MRILAEAAEHSGYFRETWGILTDPAHITAEIIIEVVPGIALYPVARRLWKRALRRHDAQAHGIGET